MSILLRRQTSSRCIQHRGNAKQEQGIAMVITLMMGMVLLAGGTGLLSRMLMSRKLGASESYQQMAEAAALNGFNRILGNLNKNNPDDYRGYLLTLDNIEPSTESDPWTWEAVTGASNIDAPPLQELCIDTSNGLPASAPENWPRTLIQATEGGSQRNDGKGAIQLFYRLRGYSGPGTSGIGEGVFEVEGIVKREGESGVDDYLARTLLRRSLYVQSKVAGDGNWAVMGGHYMELAGSSITDSNGAKGSGQILLDLDSASAVDINRCQDNDYKASLVRATPSDLGEKVWPTLNRGLPLPTLFNQDGAIDADDNGDPRIWSFDDSSDSDTRSAANESFHTQCPDDEIVCVRTPNSLQFSKPTGISVRNNVITIQSSNICKEQSGFECHLYVEHLDLRNSKLLIENNNRPVVLHLEKPLGDTVDPNLSGMIQLRRGSMLCGVNNGSTVCNEQPERLIISAGAGNTGMTCNDMPHTLRWEGNTLATSSLPHAIIHLPRGVVKPFSDAALNGVIWAHSICAGDGNIQLITETNRGTVIGEADSLWQWSEKGFPGYGRMVTRGIRGTGFDTFRRW